MYYLVLFLTGIAGGFVAGFLGGGGGIIYILILPWALKTTLGADAGQIATLTVANSLFSVMFNTFFGNLAHLRLKTFYRKEVLLVGLPGAVASILIMKYFVATEYYTPWFFNAIIILLLLFAVIQAYFEKQQQDPKVESRYNKIHLMASGMMAGSISALSGLGGGVVLIPTLKIWLKMGIKKAQSISLGMIFITTFGLSVFNLWVPVNICPNSVGLIVFPVVLPILAGVLVASPAGVRLAHNVSSRVINKVFLIFMTLVLIKKVADLILTLQ